MTDEQLSNMYLVIKNEITKMEKSIVYLEELVKPIAPDVSLGRLTRMEALGEKGVNEAVLSQKKNRLVKLKTAQQHIIEGSYGVCKQCGKEISYGRLQAVPEAVICVLCKKNRI